MKIVVDTSTNTAVSKPTNVAAAYKLCDKLNLTQREIEKPERFAVMEEKEYYRKTLKKDFN